MAGVENTNNDKMNPVNEALFEKGFGNVSFITKQVTLVTSAAGRDGINVADFGERESEEVGLQRTNPERLHVKYLPAGTTTLLAPAR